MVEPALSCPIRPIVVPVADEDELQRVRQEQRDPKRIIINYSKSQRAAWLCPLISCLTRALSVPDSFGRTELHAFLKKELVFDIERTSVKLPCNNETGRSQGYGFGKIDLRHACLSVCRA